MTKKTKKTVVSAKDFRSMISSLSADELSAVRGGFSPLGGCSAWNGFVNDCEEVFGWNGQSEGICNADRCGK